MKKQKGLLWVGGVAIFVIAVLIGFMALQGDDSVESTQQVNIQTQVVDEVTESENEPTGLESEDAMPVPDTNLTRTTAEAGTYVSEEYGFKLTLSEGYISAGDNAAKMGDRIVYAFSHGTVLNAERFELFVLKEKDVEKAIADYKSIYNIEDSVATLTKVELFGVQNVLKLTIGPRSTFFLTHNGNTFQIGKLFDPPREGSQIEATINSIIESLEFL